MNRIRDLTSCGAVRYDAAGIQDASGVDRVSIAPGSLLMTAGSDGPEILAAGTPGDVDRHPASASARRIELPSSVLLPGFVNAHTHLDLTHVGPRPIDPSGGFVAFADLVRTARRADDEGIADSVRRGIELCRKGGTAAVGDIAGAAGGRPSLVPWRTLAASGLAGVSFLEFFAIGRVQADWLARVQAALDAAQASPANGAARLGLQPHAPNSVSLAAYAWATEQATARSLPLSTHLAETPEERQFIADGRGPMRDFLERLGIWDHSPASEIGHGRHPVEHLAQILRSLPFVVAHVNDADDVAIQTLAQSGASVAYCPRASEYFGAATHFGPHRYRDMVRAGVNVALGTDSIINLPTAEVVAGGLSILDEARLLHRRDGTDPDLLLAMATVNGAAALGLERSRFTFGRGSRVAGVVAVDVTGTDASGVPMARALASAAPARLLPDTLHGA